VSGVCLCGHDAEAHEHYRPGSDCGVCGAVVCPRFRPDPDVARTDQAIDAVLRGDIDRALDLAGRQFVALLVALRDTGRAAA
jgi:hypothetical protein